MEVGKEIAPGRHSRSTSMVLLLIIYSLLTYLQPYDKSELRPGSDSASQDTSNGHSIHTLGQACSPIVL